MDRIQEKLAKLQALAERAGTTAEAEVAVQKMQQLILKYNLHNWKSSNSSVDDFTKQDVHIGKNNWKRMLFQVLGKQFLLYSAYRRNSPDLIVIGRQENITIAVQIFNWIVPQLERLAEEEYNNILSFRRSQKKSWKNSFFLGAVSRIRERLNEDYNSLSSDDKAIMLNQEHLLNSAVRRLLRGYKLFSDSIKPSDSDGYFIGRKSADNVSLHNRKAITE